MAQSNTPQNSYTIYRSYANAVALLWGILSCGYVIINVIVFIQPQWLGRIDEQHIPSGYFGLYQRCLLTERGVRLRCSGTFRDFSTIDNEAFKASTFFIGVSCLIVFICIGVFLLFFVLKHSVVFAICGILQLISGLFMFLGCIIYPAGWKSTEVQNLCGSNAESFVIGGCSIGWAYILAIVGIFNALFLAILAFSLALRQDEFAEKAFAFGATKSDMNGFIEDNSSSKPSMFIQPTFCVPEEDRISELSHSTKKSKRSNFAL